MSINVPNDDNKYKLLYINKNKKQFIGIYTLYKFSTLAIDFGDDIAEKLDLEPYAGNCFFSKELFNLVKDKYILVQQKDCFPMYMQCVVNKSRKLDIIYISTKYDTTIDERFQIVNADYKDIPNLIK